MDDLDLIALTLNCSYQANGGGIINTFHKIILKVTDANDNAPVFLHIPYITDISEASPIGTTVYGGISAMDKDASKNKELEFSIVSGAFYKGVKVFTMRVPSSGIITLETKLDYEELINDGRPIFVLGIMVKDKAENTADQKSSTATLTVSVTDSDDCPPSFWFPGCLNSYPTFDVNCDAVVYSGSITSGAMNNSGILMYPEVNGVVQQNPVNIVAVDIDNLNAPLTFKIVSGFPSGIVARFVLTPGPKTINSRHFYPVQLMQISPVKRSEARQVELIIQVSNQ